MEIEDLKEEIEELTEQLIECHAYPLTAGLLSAVYDFLSSKNSTFVISKKYTGEYKIATV